MSHLQNITVLLILLVTTLISNLNAGAILLKAYTTANLPHILAYISSIYTENNSTLITAGKSQVGTLPIKQNLVIKCKGGVGELAFAPNGKILAISAKVASTVRLFDTSTGQLMAELKAQDNWLSIGILNLQFSPNSQTVAIQNLGNKIRLWDVKTGTLKNTLVSSGDLLFAVAFSPDSQTIATASYEKPTISFWDVETGHLKHSMNLPGENYAGRGVTHLAFSPDGKILAASDYGGIFFLHTDTRKLIGALTGHKSTIYRLAFSPDGKTLATASRDETAKLWDIETKKLKATLVGHKNKIVNVTFSPDGQTVITESYNKVVKFWDVATCQLKMTMKDIRWFNPVVAFSPDGRLFATASNKEKSINLWDAKTYKVKAFLPEMRSPMVFSPDGKMFAAEGKDDTVILWELP